ncbi:MAG: hypothetical protein JNM78_11870 [Cyclobacteriaceae bacterium]|nr:hypothetical protein [Cyclobacteriaceae bacterium]
MKNNIFICLVAILITSCNSNLTDPQKIIDKAIAASGGDKYLDAMIAFDFRDRHYVSTRKGGMYTYERITKDSINTIHDFLSNDGFKREINGTVVEVPDSMKIKYTSSVNSVVYFALLPYGLNDASVKKKFLGETQLEGKEQYVVEISFGEEGGGEDFEDVFIYWINKKDFVIDYLAYSYDEGKGLEYRFRKAYNPRRVNGILFLDYINYQPNGETKITTLEGLYKAGKLKELSKIELENIQVK